MIINSQGIQKDSNNYIRSNGDLKWGNLTITGSSATFNGTIFADKIEGQVVDSQVASGLNAGKVTLGSMSGSRLLGGIVGGIGGSTINLSQSGQITINSGFVQILADSTSINMNNSTINMGGTVVLSGALSVAGSITVSGGTGISGTYSVTTPVGTRYFQFSRGILVGVTS